MSVSPVRISFKTTTAASLLFLSAGGAFADATASCNTGADINSTECSVKSTALLPPMPQHISFDLVFLNEKARWVLMDISVGQFELIAPEEGPSVKPGSRIPADGD